MPYVIARALALGGPQHLPTDLKLILFEGKLTFA